MSSWIALSPPIHVKGILILFLPQNQFNTHFNKNHYCQNKKIKKLVIHSFPGQGEHQLPLEVGDIIKVVEQHEHWYRGQITDYEGCLGIFPKNYVKICQEEEIPKKNETITSLQKAGLMFFFSTFFFQFWKKYSQNQ